MIDPVKSIQDTIAECRPVSWSQASALIAAFNEKCQAIKDLGKVIRDLDTEVARLNALVEVQNKEIESLDIELQAERQFNFDRT